jgi:hypothetical protein
LAESQDQKIDFVEIHLKPHSDPIQLPISKALD